MPKTKAEERQKELERKQRAGWILSEAEQQELKELLKPGKKRAEPKDA